MRTGWHQGIGSVVAACMLLFVLPLSAQDRDAPADVPDESAAETARSDDYYELMETFVDAFEQVERNYVKDVDRKKLVEAAIQGIVKELDPYSNYIGPEDLAEFNEDVEQEFSGVGIQVQIDPETERLTVLSPLPGGPAYKQGVKAGDVIEEIEGKSTKGFTLEDAVKLIKGPPGEAVTIGVRHLGSDEIEQITVVRDIIRVSTVLGDHYNKDAEWEFLIDPENKIGYVRLTSFSRHSTEELKEAIDQLQKRGMKALVLDLRFNPGGLLSQAVEIADMFLEEGTIVSTKGRNTEPEVRSAEERGTYPDFPMVVLVNRYSASASEIVSAALQDHERALVCGERTWGKGSVQNVIQLGDGDSALKLTTASYHRPSGKNIHRFPDMKEEDEWGVLPDEGYLIKLKSEEMRDYLNYRRDRDVISANGPPKSDYKDQHLDKALEYLRGELGAESKDESKDESKSDPDADQPKAVPADDPNADLSSRLRLRLPSVLAM